MYLPSVVASYSTGALKLLRQTAVEIHYASIKHARVRRLLRRSLDVQIAQIGEVILAAQRAGNLDRALDAELLASAVMVFTMGMMHMDTVVPRLIDDAGWHNFVQGRVAALLGIRARLVRIGARLSVLFASVQSTARSLCNLLALLRQTSEVAA